jgi:hypothetical protein
LIFVNKKILCLEKAPGLNKIVRPRPYR